MYFQTEGEGDPGLNYHHVNYSATANRCRISWAKLGPDRAQSNNIRLYFNRIQKLYINELQMDHDHTYAKDRDRELRILKKKIDLSTFPQDQENNDILCPGRTLLDEFHQEGNGISIPLPHEASKSLQCQQLNIQSK